MLSVGKRAVSTVAGRVRQFSSQFVKVEDKRIHCVMAGTGPNPLLLLPGALGTAATDFGPQLAGLAGERFTVVGWDPPGYGQSRPPPRDFTDFFRTDARLAMGTMQALGFSRFSLAGWSDGGITALIAAAVYPELVNKLFVWGANAYIAKSDIEMIEQVRYTFYT